MDDTSSDILDPDHPFTLSTGIQVTVRELTWKEAKKFLTSLASKSSEFITLGPDGQNNVDINRLMGVVATDLGESLVMAATGLEQDAVESMTASDMLKCLDRALALNLRPEMIEAGKAIAGQVTALMKKKA